jgi:hypothetical protein
VLHYPGKEKSTAFDEALKRKIDAEDFDFRGVWFPDKVEFGGFTFAKPVNFINATFSAEAFFYTATFSAGAYFNSATFKADALFNSAIFDSNVFFISAQFGTCGNFASAKFASDAEFYAATFSGLAIFETASFNGGAAFNLVIFGDGAIFRVATFDLAASFYSAKFNAEADFNSAKFNGEVSFHSTTFGDRVSFRAATFKDYVRFAGDEKNQYFDDKSSLDLQFARIEKPERFSFHTVKLRPHWFVNVDARKFEFTSVDWHWYNPHWYNRKIRGKLKRQLSEKAIPSYILLAVACRRLAVNAEENNLYWRASSFRYLAMNVERLDTGRGFAFWKVDWWYWLASGFGERIPRALVAFFVIWLSFALLFRLPNPVRCPEKGPAAYCLRWEENDKTRDYFDRFSNSAVYAVEVMTLQKPEPKPASPVAHLAVMLCALLGPVQAALLALAIRRKFMR